MRASCSPAKPDYQQGDGFRIIYVHAPHSAWMSLMVYVTMSHRRRGGAHLAHEGGTCGCGELCADRRIVYSCGTRDGLLVGQAHVGDVLGGVGSAADV